MTFSCWLVVLRMNVDLAIFQPYLDLEAWDNQSLKIQVARPGIESRSSCSASQELNHSATAAPIWHLEYSIYILWLCSNELFNDLCETPLNILYLNWNMRNIAYFWYLKNGLFWKQLY